MPMECSRGARLRAGWLHHGILLPQLTFEGGVLNYLQLKRWKSRLWRSSNLPKFFTHLISEPALFTTDLFLVACLVDSKYSIAIC